MLKFLVVTGTSLGMIALSCTPMVTEPSHLTAGLTFAIHATCRRGGPPPRSTCWGTGAWSGPGPADGPRTPRGRRSGTTSGGGVPPARWSGRAA